MVAGNKIIIRSKYLQFSAVVIEIYEYWELRNFLLWDIWFTIERNRANEAIMKYDIPMAKGKQKKPWKSFHNFLTLISVSDLF